MNKMPADISTNKTKLIRLPKDSNITRLFLTLVAIVIVAIVLKPHNFPSTSNIESIMKQLVEYGLMAFAVGITMISGGIDLSTVYIANMSGIVAGIYMRTFISPEASLSEQLMVSLVAMLIGILIGALCGIFNGILVAHFNIPAMLATLGTFQLFMGISVVISGGTTISRIPGPFTTIGNYRIFGFVPIAFVIFIIIAILLSVMMSRTKFGTRIYLVGTNAKSSKFAGINNKAVLIKVYMLAGILSSIAGLISLARVNSAKADFGSSYTMTGILIVVLGGVNPNGGFGSMTGVALAVVVLQVLSSLLNMFQNISNYYRDLIWGVALIGVLILNYMISNGKIRKLKKKN